MEAPLIIGVTGVIGSGKSLACEFLRDNFDFVWIEADKVAHELYKPGEAGYKKIKDYFGEYFVGKNGVHRGRLRKLVTKSPQKIWILSQLMHPLILNEVNKKIVQLKALSKGKKRLLVCLEAIYFEEKDLGKYVDKIFVISSPEVMTLARLKSRNIPYEDLQVFYKFQKRNIPMSGAMIENTGTEEEFYKKIEEMVVNQMDTLQPAPKMLK